METRESFLQLVSHVPREIQPRVAQLLNNIVFRADYFVAVPSSPTAQGKKGQIACDGDYFYLCWKDSTWVRVAVGGVW